MRLTKGIKILALVLFLASPAIAHDHWINQGNYLSPVDGSRCCGISDCVELAPEAVRQIVGASPGYVWRYQMPNGDTRQEFIPQNEVQLSKDGGFWRCHKPDGSRRCFFVPPQGL